MIREAEGEAEAILKVQQANADGIRVREASNTDAKILDVIDSGASLTVNTDAEEVDGWVSVDCNGTTAYVAADYVDVALNIDDAVSMEEIRAREAAAAQKAAQEAAAQAGSLIDVQAAPVVRAGNHPAVKRNLLAAGTASITGIS